MQNSKKLAFKELTKAFAASEQCAIMVKELLAEAQLSPSTISHIAVNNGPGSFTGLRVAQSFAKGFASLSDLPIIGIGAFDLILSQSDASIAVIESKRDEVYLYKAGKITLCKKADLAKELAEHSSLACDQIKDLAHFLPNTALKEFLPSAAKLCLLAEEIIATKVELPTADILYFHHFEATKK
jgi:tRNA threonylcarbamoyl adenosine modification protein YeaZ